MQAIKLPYGQMINLPDPPTSWDYDNFTNNIYYCNYNPVVKIDLSNNGSISLANDFGSYPYDFMGKNFICPATRTATLSVSLTKTDILSDSISDTLSIVALKPVSLTKTITKVNTISVSVSDSLTMTDSIEPIIQGAPPEQNNLPVAVAAGSASLLILGLVGVGVFLKTKGLLCFKSNSNNDYNDMQKELIEVSGSDSVNLGEICKETA